MEWGDDGLVLGVRRHGETTVILDAMTRQHGRHAGLVHGGRSRALRPVLQPGNVVQLAWRARLDDQLGTYGVEPLALHAGPALNSRLALHAIGAATALLRLLPERDSYPALFEAAAGLMGSLDDEGRLAARLARFELTLLADLGFGLDLSTCAVTGVTETLAYVSPKTGRAVSREAGEPWRDRLLPLPAFLLDAEAQPQSDAEGMAAIRDGFRLTGFFLERDLFDPRSLPLPDSRAAFVAAALGCPPAGVG